MVFQCEKIQFQEQDVAVEWIVKSLDYQVNKGGEVELLGQKESRSAGGKRKSVTSGIPVIVVAQSLNRV